MARNASYGRRPPTEDLRRISGLSSIPRLRTSLSAMFQRQQIAEQESMSLIGVSWSLLWRLMCTLPNCGTHRFVLYSAARTLPEFPTLRCSPPCVGTGRIAPHCGVFRPSAG